jgi:hypothetical protein
MGVLGGQEEEDIRPIIDPEAIICINSIPSGTQLITKVLYMARRCHSLGGIYYKGFKHLDDDGLEQPRLLYGGDHSSSCELITSH